MTNISESKYQNRGPLIAVIKIQLDAENVDRIFLHLKDNDQDLADQFVQKHSLNPMLKKHIFQRIQMSRQAVDKNKIKQAYEQQEDQDQYEQDSFTTPQPKKDFIFQSSSKKHVSSYKPQKQIQKSKNPQPYIAYDDSQPYEANDTFEQRYHGSFEHNHQKLFEQSKATKPIQERDSLTTKQNGNRQLNEPRNYNKDKYKNLYDVSGLKLKSSNPSVSNETLNQAGSKYSNDQYTSSQSSQGLFEKELSNQKIYQSNDHKDFIHESVRQQPIKDLKRNYSQVGNHYEPSAFRKQRAQEYVGVAEPEPTNYKPFTPSIYDSLLNVKPWKHSQMAKKDQRLSQDSYNKPHLTINKQNQTKFSSIDRVSQTDEMDLNYISFNKPNYQVASYNINKLQRPHYQKDTIQMLDNQSFTNNTVEYNNKKVGSIRSNAKNHNDTENSIKSHSQVQYINAPQPDLESTTKFNQQKLFTNIRDLQNPKNLQQNRQLNTDSSRPTVKFYTKEQMKSLKQSNISKSISKSELSRINAQVTSRLYNEVEIKKKYLDSIKARAKNQKEEELEEIEQMRDKPKISLMSKLLAENRIKQNKKLQDYLIDQGKILQLKRQEMADRQAQKKLQQCSFRPYINQESQRLSALHRSRSTSRISNHSEIKCSKRTYNNESTFHPEINKLSSAIAKDKGNFNERQNAFLQQKNSNLFKKLQEQRMKEKTDQMSGQRLFQPQLTQRTLKLAKQSTQKRQNKPIHTYLYQLSKQSHPTPHLDPKPTINPQSQKLILELQQKRLNWLFLQLDNDQDGVISSQRICIDRIPCEILQIISPVLCEMEELETELNIEDFKAAIRNLNKGLDPYQKSLLFSYNWGNKGGIRT